MTLDPNDQQCRERLTRTLRLIAAAERADQLKPGELDEIAKEGADLVADLLTQDQHGILRSILEVDSVSGELPPRPTTEVSKHRILDSVKDIRSKWTMAIRDLLRRPKD